ncbi:MAG TPA: monovalent cation/H+ antiporter complex subunit F [Pseudolabrys sp.]|jgi:multicomponent Na+:H+ antiporter subunit F|nr:monovalent cation/H+ antiporter complex subunit F [Pseudolabrys sp.]
MAFMNVWLFATLALLLPFACAAFLALRGTMADRLVAVQFASAVAVFILMLLAKAVDQRSFLDLALTLVLVTYPGTLIYTHFLERWL